MVEIILIRHGLTLWNREARIQGISDVELAPEGLRQAELLAKNFPFDKVDAIYSSDLNRAKTTAEVIASRFNLPITTMAEFRETNFGSWEGRSFEDLAKEEPTEFKKFFLKPDMLNVEGAETFAEVQNRAVTALRKIAHEHDNNKNVVIVTHGAVIRVILTEILGMPLRKMWVIKQYNTAVNILRVDDGAWSVELINSTLHLHI